MLVLLLACAAPGPGDTSSADTAADDTATPRAYPDVADLPEQVDPPDPFVTFFGGEPVPTVAAWEDVRRPELLDLFAHYQYGFPAEPPDVSVTHAADVSLTDATLPAGSVLRELTVTYDDAPPLHVALFLPPDRSAPPVLVGLDKCGNQTVTADPAVTPSAAWIEGTCDPARGSRAGYWSLDLALAAGVAVAVVHQSELDPDDREDTGRADGVHPHYAPPEPAWATLAAWGWGLSRVVDGLLADGGVDADRIAVFGHSRRGKAALLAGARDDRIALVWAHQSGTGGASLSRSLDGESIGAITALYPHWFVPDFARFYEHETLLPVDQHLLLALTAPRPLLVTDGADDDWADPTGAEAAVALAAPVWELYGAPPPTWALRDGEHEVRPDDWERFLAFAEASW